MSLPAASTSSSASSSSHSPPQPLKPDEGGRGRQQQPQQSLQLLGIIGFNGSVPGGVLLHQDDERIVYPLGSTLVVKSLTGDNRQRFLSRGHDRDVSAVALSPCGRFVASGQMTHMGFMATICVWDLQSLSLLHQWSAHKGRVQSLSFSPDSSLLASLGGRDDQKLIVWDLQSGQSLCGAVAANDSANTIRFLSRSPHRFVTGGCYNLRVWTLDREGRKLSHIDCQLGQLKRVIVDIAVNADDSLMFCGTTTGDVLSIDISAALYKGSHPTRLLAQGVNRVLLLRTGGMVVGTGDGSVVLMDGQGKVVKTARVSGGVTSLVLNAAGDHFFVGTESSRLYLVSVAGLEMELRMSCHTGKVSGVAFPYGCSQLFATASCSDITVWNAQTLVELLRIQIPGSDCLSLIFAPDGKSIVSGWMDGKIRAFTPQTGKLLWCVEDAHIGGVTALVSTSDGRRLVSGGEGGHVRVWSVERAKQKMICSMKEHQQRVNALVIDASNDVAVSASNDGSCILWSLSRYTRLSCLFSPTQFKSLSFHPEYAQLLTSGSDRKLQYWDVVGCEAIRVMEGGGAVVNSVCVSDDGELFVSGGEDKLVRVWEYDRGICLWSGSGHAGSISHVAISPDGRSLVSVGDEGALLLWAMPQPDIERDGKRVERTNLRELSAAMARAQMRDRKDEEEKEAIRPPRKNKKHVMHVRE